MATNPDTISKLQEYAAKVKETDYHLEGADAEPDYGARISRTLQSLQSQVKQHQDALEKLRGKATGPSIDEPSEDPKARLTQLRTITAAYKSLTSSEPLLPLPDSPLPALLALRSTLNLVDQTKSSIRETKASIDTVGVRLQQEQKDLQDARAITQALQQRIEKLQLQDEEEAHKSPEDTVKTMMQEQQQKRKTYLAELRISVIAFNRFVDQHLAAMVAAEDLGGPAVGDLLDISDEMLAAGFNKQGRVNKGKAADAKRKRRIEEVWGEGEEDSETEERSEKIAATKDFRALVEDLLNVNAEDGGEKAYVNIRREGAAVRFLVRANIAQFHPEDARKLRLIDFGTGLDQG